MIESETKKTIEEYIKRISRLLPDSFAAEDLLVDLRAHIDEAMQDKISNNPSEKQSKLIQEVLDDVGTPEDIAGEFLIEQVQEPEISTSDDRFRYYVVRLIAAFIVAVLAAWIVSVVTHGAVDFYFAVVVLMAFAVIEWFIRAKQSGER